MKVEKYQLKSESSLTIFEFISEGPKGLIRKRVEFQKTNDPRVYNLAFGDKNPDTGEINDTIISNNADSEKVLATVVAAVYASRFILISWRYWCRRRGLYTIKANRCLRNIVNLIILTA